MYFQVSFYWQYAQAQDLGLGMRFHTFIVQFKMAETFL